MMEMLETWILLVENNQNMSRMMRGEACPADGCETVPAVPGSWSDRPRSGTASSGIVLLTF